MTGSHGGRGFTLIELLLVLFLVALLASLVAPVITGNIGRARESALKEDLHALRKAIDDYYADNGVYPADLDEMVTKRYLRKVPVEPITERRDGWALTRAEGGPSGKSGGVIDVHSASDENGSDGVPYKEW